MPKPGSDEAVKLGCLCPVIDNNYGKGIGSEPLFYIRGDCKLHSLSNMKGKENVMPNDKLKQSEIELDKIRVEFNYPSIGGANNQGFVPLDEKTKAQLQKLIDTACVEAEERMGDAVIERMRQSNYQWEKAESLIQSYQTQKTENVHNLKALTNQERTKVIFKDPIAPRYGQGQTSHYKKRFAWLPLTTDDGYGIWLEHYWFAVFGGANTNIKSKIKHLQPAPKTNQEKSIDNE